MSSAGAPASPARRLGWEASLAVAAALLSIAVAASAQVPAPAAPAPPEAAARSPREPGPAPAAEAPAGPAGPAEPAQPEPIALPEVASAAERASASLEETGRALADDPHVNEIAAALPRRREELAAERAELQAEIVSGRSLRSLADQELIWSGHGDALRAWVDALGARVVEIQRRRDELAALEATWEATLEAAREQQAPPGVLARIRAIIAEARSARVRAQERAAAVLTLQGAVADLARQADEVIGELRVARSSVEAQLLEPDQPPIWRALPAADGFRAVGEQARASVARDLARVRDLARSDWQGLAAYSLLIALVLPLTFALRVRSRTRRHEGRALGASDWVFEHPISMAVLATLPLAWWWIFPSAPPALLRLVSLLLWIPVVRVLRRLVPERLHAALYALAAFFVIDRLRDVLEPAPIAERSLFVLELLVAIALLARLLRPKRLEGLPPDAPLPRAAGVGMRVAAIALAAALVANVLGFVDLSRVIGESVFGAVYLGVVLFAIARVLQLLMLGLLRTRRARRLRLVQTRGDDVQRRFARLVAWLAGVLWLWTALRFFGVRDPALAAARRVLAANVTVGSLAFSLGDVVAFAVTIWLAVWVSRILRVVLEDEVFPRASLARGVPQAISKVAQYAVLMIGFLLAAAAAGFDWSRITLLAGAFGVGIGFGLQNVVNNFVSGLILLFERPVQVGDIVQQGDLVGEVRRIGIRSSTVRTAEGAEVIVPNADLISQRVVNWTLSDRNRLIAIPIGVAYGTPPERVLALLDQVGRAHPDTLADPAPLVLLRAFGESSLDFELRIWTARPERMLATRSELSVAIHAALAAAGIEIPFPQRDLRLVAVEADAAEALAAASGAPANAASAAAPPAASSAVKR